jgi:hypothetical protein
VSARILLLALAAATLAACTPEVGDEGLEPIVGGTALEALTSVAVWSYDSAQIASNLGWQLAVVGDVDGDGWADAAIGCRKCASSGQFTEGWIYVFLGAEGGLEAAPAWILQSDNPGALLGSTVAGADINGDGFADILGGAPEYDGASTTEGGAVLVWLGGPGGLVSTTPDIVLEPGQDTAEFGYALASAGDVDGDGDSEIMIGSPFYGAGGAVFVYFGDPDWTSIEASTPWLWQPGQSSATGGSAVAGLGDVNGDGYGDVAIGAGTYDGWGTDTGRIWIFHGNGGGLATAHSWSADGENGGSNFGDALAGPGDLDGDGYSDVVVGAYDQGDSGKIYAWYGGSGGITTSGGWSDDLGSGFWGSWFGEELSAAGDVNGDGYADFLVGAFDYESTGGQSAEGAAFLYYGGPSGPGSTWDWHIEGNESQTRTGEGTTGGDVDGDGISDVLIGSPFRDTTAGNNAGRAELWLGRATHPSLPSTGIWSPLGAADSQFGTSVSTAGDIDGDGYDDVLVGAPAYANGETDEGAVHLHLGGPDGPSLAASWTDQGDQDGALLGTSVAGIGDVDGDGFEDFAAGAPGAWNTVTGEGKIVVYSGDASGLPTEAWSYYSTQAGAGAGHVVAGIGDVNGDGYADFAVGAPLWNMVGSDRGAVWAFFGGADFFDNLTSTEDWYLLGPGNDDQLGWSVSGAGDVNGDLFDDVIVGIPGHDTSFGGAGKAEIYLGSASGLDATAWWSTTGAATSDQHGYSVAGAGDLDGDGLADVVVGRPYAGATDTGWIGAWLGGVVMSTSPWGTATGTQDWELMGWSVAGVGDTNCDGFADIAAGSPDAASLAGRASLFPSEGTWLPGSAVWFVNGVETGARLGASIAGAGDVNGDGCADLIAGAPLTTGSGSSDGRAFVWIGNNSGDAEAFPNPWAVQALETATWGPIAPGGRAPDASFAISMLAWSPFGRRTVQLEAEIKETGVPFDGTGLVLSDPIDSGVAGTIGQVLSGPLDEGTPYHWRARLAFALEETPPQRHTRWLYGGRLGGSEGVHVRTGCADDLDGDGVCDSDDDDIDGDGDPNVTDCDDADPLVYVGAPEACNGADDDCDATLPLDEQDVDVDGVMACDGDCDDADPLAWPGAPETCDGVDQNCDGDATDEDDDDGDGASECEGDCDDASTLVWPGFPVELCDGLDNDCDGAVPADEADVDGDGFRVCDGDCDDGNASAYPGAPEASLGGEDLNCDGAVGTDADGDFYAIEAGDCDDNNVAVYPTATELCDGFDNDCDGVMLAGELVDVDADGARACEDCDDWDAAIHPAATEVCNGVDDDCDGVLMATEYDADDDGVTACAGDCDDFNPLVFPGQVEDCTNGFDDDCIGGVDIDSDVDNDGASSCAGDCDDGNNAIGPSATELCNGLDDNCNGLSDEGFDLDADGVTTCMGDCADLVPTVYPGAPAICDDLVDNDCDPNTLEGIDADGDGAVACPTDGSQADCWEGNPTVYPTASELCDWADNDCDGAVDEGFDSDGDGWTTCAGDCDDSEFDAHPGLAEICGDGLDNDCAGDGDAVCPGDDDDSAGDDDDSATDDDDSATDDDDSAQPDDDDATPDDDDSATDDDDSATDDDDSATDDDDSAVTDDDDATPDDDDSATDDDDVADDDDSAGAIEVFVPPGCVCGGSSLVGRSASGGWLAGALLIGVVGLRRRRSGAS